MTLTKNGKKMGRPLGSKTKPKTPTDNRRLNQAKIIGDLQNRLAQANLENFHMIQSRELMAQDIEKLRAELAKSQLACLDSIAVIRYLEKKVFDLVKAA